MRTIRVAAVIATIGLGVFAVGCGPQPSAGTGSSPSVTKSTPTGGTSGTKPTTTGSEGSDLVGKKKAAAEDANKELTPLKDAFEKMKTKVAEDEKAAGTDALKLTAVGMLKEKRDAVEKDLKEINDKIGGLAGAKDDKGLTDAKKAIADQIEKVKPLLKDYLPAK